jgi:hypothetical protein
MIDPAYLHECFIYDPASGVLTWKPRPREHFNTDHGWRIFSGKHAGKAAGNSTDRYVKVILIHDGQRKQVYAHQCVIGNASRRNAR